MSLSAAGAIALSGRPLSLPFSDGEELGASFDAVGQALLSGSWDDIATASQRAVALGQGTADALVRYRAGYPGSATRLAGILAAALAANLAARPDAAAVTANILGAVDDATRAELNAAGILAAVSAGDTDGLIARLAAPRSIAGVDPRLALALIARGSLGVAHATFNHTRQSPVALPGLDATGVREVFTGVIDRFEETFDASLQALQTACVTGDVEVVRFAAVGAAQRACIDLPRLAALQGRIHHLYRGHIDAGRGTEAERVGRLAVRANLHSRTLLAAQLAGVRVAMASGDSTDPEDVSAVLSSAHAVPFSRTLPNGLNRSITQLADEDGSFVEVDGMVVAKSAHVDDEDRLIGRLTLRDPSSGAEVEAVALFVNPINAGIADGIHARLSGVFHASLTLAAGAPGLLIDRFAFTTLDSEQWRLPFLRLAKDVFPIWRNGHNVMWGMGPHAPAAPPNPGENGAAEVLFLNFDLEAADG